MADDDLEFDESAAATEPDEAADDEESTAEGETTETFVEAEAVEVEEEVAETTDEAPKRGRRSASGEPMNEQARKSLRAQLESDVEAFLNKGGKIEAVPMDVRTDLPKKPESKYGSRSI